MKDRRWRLSEKLTLTVVIVIVVIGLGLLIRWDMSRECVRWATRVDSTGYDAHQTSVCVEYQSRKP